MIYFKPNKKIMCSINYGFCKDNNAFLCKGILYEVKSINIEDGFVKFKLYDEGEYIGMYTIPQLEFDVTYIEE